MYERESYSYKRYPTYCEPLEIKSGREKRREKRKKQRKAKALC